VSKSDTEQRFIEPADLRGRLAQDDKLVVIDVRSTEEFEAWHVDGAINIPSAELAARVTEIPQDAAVITI
jgi:rhodanese-related sulfurtransferase